MMAQNQDSPSPRSERPEPIGPLSSRFLRRHPATRKRHRRRPVRMNLPSVRAQSDLRSGCAASHGRRRPQNRAGGQAQCDRRAAASVCGRSRRKSRLHPCRSVESHTHRILEAARILPRACHSLRRTNCLRGLPFRNAYIAWMLDTFSRRVCEDAIDWPARRDEYAPRRCSCAPASGANAPGRAGCESRPVHCLEFSFLLLRSLYLFF